MKQLSEQEAIKFAQSGQWKDWTSQEIASFQFFQKRLCIPFSTFHEAVEKELGRPVYTYEFRFPNLKWEFEGKIPTQTLEDVINLIPLEKRIIIDSSGEID